MTFGSPIWLWGLLPWALLAIYLRRRKGELATVPFLGFWQTGTMVAARRGKQWPGLAVWLVLIALLMAVFAAADPRAGFAGVSDADVSIILDRGASMALASGSGADLRDLITKAGPIGERSRVELIPIPGQRIVTTGAAWQAIAMVLPVTAVQTQLDQAVSNELRQTRGPVLVLSNQKLNVSDPRIVQITPPSASNILAITDIAARALPTSQVMIRLENRSALPMVKLRVQSGNAEVERDVQFDHVGHDENRDRNEVTEFIDLPALGALVTATLDAQSGPWSTAQLVRQSKGVRVLAGESLAEPFHRLADLYNRNRLPAADAPVILITDQSLAANQAGVQIGDSSEPGQMTDAVVVIPHPVTKNVQRWPAGDHDSAPQGFEPVVVSNKRPIVAVRDGLCRQVWINGDLSDWEKSPDFVVFFANTFDWIAGSETRYSAITPAYLGKGWHAADQSETRNNTRPGEWPGVYESDSGQRVAVNAGPFPATPSAVESTSALRSYQSNAQRSIAPAVILAALVSVLIAASLWPKKAESGAVAAS